MVDIKVSDRVTVFDKQLHGNQSNLIDGQVLSIQGSSASVQVDGEEFPRTFTLDSLKSSEETYGAERTSHYDNVVVDAIRRF